MLIRIGADHRGFKLKETLVLFLRDQGYEVVDMGNARYVPDDDYVDFAAAVAKAVSLDPEQNRGILICGSGSGMDIAANKFPHVRATLGISMDQVHAARNDDDINVLCLASDFVGEEDAKQMARVFLHTPFGREERYLRRLQKIKELEHE